MAPELQAAFDKWEASFDALYRYLEDTASGVSEPATASSDTAGCVTEPVQASSGMSELVTASAGLAEPPAPAPSIVASPVAAPAAPIDTIAVAPMTCSTECPSCDDDERGAPLDNSSVDVVPVLAASAASAKAPAVPALIHELKVLRPAPWPSFISSSVSMPCLTLVCRIELVPQETRPPSEDKVLVSNNSMLVPLCPEQRIIGKVTSRLAKTPGSDGTYETLIDQHGGLGIILLGVLLVWPHLTTSVVIGLEPMTITGALGNCGLISLVWHFQRLDGFSNYTKTLPIVLFGSPMVAPLDSSSVDGVPFSVALFQWEIAWQLVATMQSERGVFTICLNRKRKFVTIDGVLGDLHPANPYEEEEFGSSSDSVQSVWSILSIHQLPLLGWTGSVVSLTSLDEGGSIHPACTGIVFYHAKTRACLLTSLSLFRSSDDYRKISFRTETKVRLPNDQVVSGIPIFHDLKSNLSVVSVLPKGCLLPAACLDHHQQLESHSQVVSVRRCFISGELLATTGMLAGDPTCTYREEAADEGLLVDSFGNFVGFNCYSKEGTTFIPRSTILEFFWQLVSLDSEPSLKLPKFLVWPNKQHGELWYVSELYLEKFSGMFRQSLQGCESFQWTNDCSIPFGDYLCSNKTTEVHTPWDPGKSVLRYPLKRLGDKPSFKEGGMLGPSPAHVSLGRCLGPATTASAQLIASFKSSSTNIQGKQRKRYPGRGQEPGGGGELSPIWL